MKRGKGNFLDDGGCFSEDETDGIANVTESNQRRVSEFRNEWMIGSQKTKQIRQLLTTGKLKSNTMK